MSRKATGQTAPLIQSYPSNEVTNEDYASKMLTIKDELYELGLSTNEVDVFALLAKHGPRKASDVSRILSIPRTETYVTLSNLQSKGIVRAIRERPVRFEALPFEQSFKLLVDNKIAETASCESLLPNVLQMWHSLPLRQVDEISSEQFQKIRGTHRVYHKLREMTQGTLRELVIMGSAGDLGKLEAYGILNEMRSLSKNDVHVGIITEPGYDATSSGSLDIFGSSLTQDKLPHLILKDREELLAITTEESDSKETVALWTNCSTLCEAVHLLYSHEYQH